MTARLACRLRSRHGKKALKETQAAHPQPVIRTETTASTVIVLRSCLSESTPSWPVLQGLVTSQRRRWGVFSAWQIQKV